MIKKIKTFYRNLTLTAKIRYSYQVLLVPMMLILLVSIIFLYSGNNRYREMVESAGAASQFSLDFKNDFDYETYLVVVENKTLEESELYTLLEDANRIVDDLDKLTDPGTNRERLESAKKYLSNLETYLERISMNLAMGNRYEENMLIWENDVQIVTSLIQDSINEYIFYEIRDIQETRERVDSINLKIILITGIVSALLFIATIVFSYVIPESITKPILEISEVTRQVSEGNLSVRTNIEYGDEVKKLGDDLNIMIDKIESLIDQVTLEQIRLRHAELELLQAQINPHFLYNTLDTIVWLAEAGDQKKVISMVGALSQFFRTSLNQGHDNISISEELKHAGSYLEIQQVRYQDILSYEINVPEELYPYIIPKITLQPLIENALYHGIKNKRGKGHISINGKIVEDTIVIEVKDNGIGMNEERLEVIRERISNENPDSKEAFGLFNVNERIRLRVGDGYGLSITSVYGEGTTVTVRLPMMLSD